jgi:NitT/TauT family transport system ATP-binding protein
MPLSYKGNFWLDDLGLDAWLSLHKRLWSPGNAEHVKPELLRLDGIAKEYRTKDGKTILGLADATLSLAKEAFVSVVGPSGCGKTTLLKILANVIKPTRGQIQFNTNAKSIEHEVGVVFQTPVLLPWATVLDNVLLPAKILRRPRRDFIDRANDLLTLIGLREFATKYPFELSGGMQQRVSIARALLHKPDLLLMDEPFGALDALTRDRLNLELQRIWMAERKTVFFITHSIPEAILLSDRIIVMSARPGRIVEDIVVDFERPRDLSIVSTPAFGRLADRVRDALEAQ